MDESTADDKLRMEAFDLSAVCRETADLNIPEHCVEDMLKKSERLMHLRATLGFKLVHQLEAAETTFHLAMLSGDISKAKTIAGLAENMAFIRCGNGKLVEDWKKRKEDPILYLLG